MSRSATMSVMSVTLKGHRLLFALRVSETAYVRQSVRMTMFLIEDILVLLALST